MPKVYVLIGDSRKPFEAATDEELRSLDRVRVLKDGTEEVLTQAQMRTNALLFCKEHHLSFKLALFPGEEWC